MVFAKLFRLYLQVVSLKGQWLWDSNAAVASWEDIEVIKQLSSASFNMYGDVRSTTGQLSKIY